MNDEIHSEHEVEAWEAFMRARKDWKRRGAPSVGARASAILADLLYPPSYIRKAQAALALYLSAEQRAERYGVAVRRWGVLGR